MKKTKTSYLLRGTPSLLLIIGAGFVMASSSDIRAALGMGAAVLVSMLLSSIVISAIHKAMPAAIKLPAYVLIITGFVSLISMLMQAYTPVVVDMLGVHLAALSVSAVIYRDAEEVADHNGEATSIKTAIVTNVAADRFAFQRNKIDALGLTPLFDVIVLSGEVGVHKPDLRVFNHATKQLGVANEDCVFVGDNADADIVGALNAGMEAVWIDAWGDGDRFAGNPKVHRVKSVLEYFQF